MNIRVMGFGGQGVVTLGRALCNVALFTGYFPSMVLSKGSTQTGGPVRCDIRLFDAPHRFDGVVSDAASFDSLTISKQGHLEWKLADMVRSNMVTPEEIRALSIPPKGANFFLLGCYLAVCDNLTIDHMSPAVSQTMPPERAGPNIELCNAGYAFAQQRHRPSSKGEL
ncbi:2-oxoacid:acceptor oxidoreductase family protein [Enterovibrio coralii]|uniref:Pyruvate/ketoisovalerate oxidoreductase catalytic domain-containing protein n=1 Tax=Enterovibrio coralii TaxID=294935 RepID=A0A135I564_9GAMM|nr:2-oxoacid:acceptor oxidoreductase family protein [Enterovibrio coralii]KXF80537.1 hypothetical protein ATN88_07575 [Enterovibrio coralii]